MALIAASRRALVVAARRSPWVRRPPGRDARVGTSVCGVSIAGLLVTRYSPT
jgi:hypothetical protein